MTFRSRNNSEEEQLRGSRSERRNATVNSFSKRPRFSYRKVKGTIESSMIRHTFERYETA